MGLTSQGQPWADSTASESSNSSAFKALRHLSCCQVAHGSADDGFNVSSP